MKPRALIFAFAFAICLSAQKPGGIYGAKQGFNFTESCFRNPSLPYCVGRDFVIKPTKDGKGGPAFGTAAGEGMSTIDAAGIDWRFADPSADVLAVLDSSKLQGSGLAHNLIDQLASSQRLNPAEAQNVFRALSGMDHVALSVHGDTMLILITGRPADAILPALEAGWKSAAVGQRALLIGRAAAVAEASQRLAAVGPLGELPQAAQQRPADNELWVAGSANVAGPEAVSAGVKRFELMASMSDHLSSVTAFEFEASPDPAAIKTWLSTLGDPKIDGNAVLSTTSLDADAARSNLPQIAGSPLGRGLAAFIQSARYLPLRDTGTTARTKPVIFGLDEGPREVK